MRFLHTADWHLGRPFHGEDLLGHQAQVLDWLVELAAAERVDAVVVAGDVFDRALPPVAAVELADEALARLVAVAPVVLISGNHDSAQRLRFNARLARAAGLHVLTDPRRCGTPVELGGARFYGIPYLEPDAVRDGFGLPARSGHAAVLEAAMARVRAAEAGAGRGGPVVVVAHAFVAGATSSPSERDLAIGGAAAVGSDVFAGADYVALGHLHGPQAVGAAGRYAGSPLAFSFGEAAHRKSAAVVSLAPDGSWTHELHLAPVPRRLVALSGPLEALLSDPRHAAAEDAWVAATLTDAVRPADAMGRLRVRFPHCASLAFEPEGASPAEPGYASTLGGLDDGQLVARFVEHVRGTEAGEAELALLGEALGAEQREAVR